MPTWLRHSLAIRFLHFLWQRFDEDRCLQHAAALAYTTLLSLVPFMAVSFSLFTAFPAFKNFSINVQSLLIENFVPTSGAILQSYLQEFTSKASHLTATGVAGLILTSLMMMAAIDKALNTIWRSQMERGAIKGFLVYWAILTLAPFLIGVSIAISSYFLTLPFVSQLTISQLGLLRLTPFLLSFVAFSLMYIIVPNRYVPYQHAIYGGLLASLLFELAKKSFAFYVTSFPTYEAIYGAMATLPIFLVWIYVSWLVILIGAEFTHALSAFRQAERKYGLFPDEELRPAFRILGHLWQAQQNGNTLSTKVLLEKEALLKGDELEAILQKLVRIRFVHRTLGESWALSRDLHQVTLRELYYADDFALPHPTQSLAHQDEWDVALDNTLVNVSLKIESDMNVVLANLYRSRD